jgi:hypothetical protein
MSKASEWAAFLREHRPPAFQVGEGPGSIILGYINDQGELQSTGATIEPEHAAPYGQWIVDMFSERSTEPKATPPDDSVQVQRQGAVEKEKA